MGSPSAICLYSGNHSNHHLPDLILSSPVLKECWTRGWDLGGGSLKWTSWTSSLPSLGLGLLCTIAAWNHMPGRALSPRNRMSFLDKKKNHPSPSALGSFGEPGQHFCCVLCVPLVLPVSDKGSCVRACEPTAEEADCRNSDRATRGKDGTLSVHRADTSIPSTAGINNGSPGAAVAGTGKTGLSVTGEARSSRSTPSQQCPPLELGLGESRGG